MPIEEVKIPDDIKKLMQGIKVSELVKMLEDQSDAMKNDYGECKATMIVNFGPSGRTAQLINGDERLLVMIIKVLEHYIPNS